MTELPHSHGDFETRSTTNLKTAGSHVYAENPRTEPLCFSWTIGDEPIELWEPGQPAPRRLFDHLAAGGAFVGHNAFGFELLIWNQIMVPRFGWPPLLSAQVRDTMQMAYAMGLPASLENCAAALGLEIRKDGSGRQHMLKMASPLSYSSSGEPVWWDPPGARERLGSYCIQDSAVERELEKRLMQLSAQEQRFADLDGKINGRGLFIDIPAAIAAVEIIEAEKVRIGKELSRLTDGAVTAVTQAARIKEWIETQGVALSRTAKAEVTEALDDPNLPMLVRRVLELRREGAKSSTAKLKTLIACVNTDHRARGCFVYHGAHTGRAAGRRAQFTNLPKPTVLTQAEIDEIMDFLGQPEDPFS